MRIVPISAVKSEAVLAKHIYNATGNILLKKGVKLTQSLLLKIEENNVYTIYINDEYSNEEINDVIRPEIRQKAVHAVMETFKNIESSNRLSKSGDPGLREGLIIKSMEKYLDTLKSISKFIIDDLTNNHNLLINLVDIKNIDNYTYQHSVNVAIISLVIGIEMKLSRENLQTLFMGALLHDIGKTLLPRTLLAKRETYTDEEAEIIKEHCELGYRYLKENFTLPTQSYIVALQHHERYDGSGYPKQAKGDLVHKFSRIVSIADCFDSMTSDRPTSKAAPVNEVIEYIMGSAGSQFDFDMATIFSRKVIPYPPGTYVKLSSGDVAVVRSINPNFPLRPKIEIINKSSSDYRKEIDLMETTNIVIKNIQYEDPNI
ncbi:MAG: HD-GYP domain-containing protein [Acidaminobacteraceae bacterium]